MYEQDSLVDLCIQDDYKSLCAVVTICATLLNMQIQIHVHRQQFDQLI